MLSHDVGLYHQRALPLRAPVFVSANRLPPPQPLTEAQVCVDEETGFVHVLATGLPWLSDWQGEPHWTGQIIADLMSHSQTYC